MLRDRFDVPDWAAHGLSDGSVDHISYGEGKQTNDAVAVMADGREVEIPMKWLSQMTSDERERARFWEMRQYSWWQG